MHLKGKSTKFKIPTLLNLGRWAIVLKKKFLKYSFMEAVNKNAYFYPLAHSFQK